MFRTPKGFAAAEDFTGHRWDSGRATESHDAIANESALALVYNGRPFVVMMVTPQDIEDFVLGFSLSEGIIRSASELSNVRVRTVADGIEADMTIAGERFRELDRKQRNLTGRVGCGLCGAQTLAQAVRHPPPVPRTTSISANALQRAMTGLDTLQPLNARTGAIHAAAWLTETGDIALVREDVGRHNALDKLIGAMTEAEVTSRRGAAIITSRASHEMIQKAAVMGMEILCAISAPTALAIRLAEETGLTLIAFARGSRHTVYTHPERLAYREDYVTV